MEFGDGPPDDGSLIPSGAETLAPAGGRTCPKCWQPTKYHCWEIVNAILYIYILQTGAPWRMLPQDLPPYCIVFHYYRA